MSLPQNTDDILINIMTNYVNRFLQIDIYDWLVYCKFVNRIIELYQEINNPTKTNELIINTLKFLEKKIELIKSDDVVHDCINFVLKLNNVLHKNEIK